MRMRTGFLALLVGAAAMSTAAFAQYDNPRDDRSGGGFSNQGRSQSQGGDRYDPSTGGRYRYDDRWDRRYHRGPPPWAHPRWRDYDRYDRYDRYYDRDRYDRYRYDDRW